ncbi:MAG: hypothetical protein WC869_13505 [Phycisphaerae bacterium]
MKKFILSFAAVAAILGSFAISPSGTPANAAGELRTQVACSPLTSSQAAQPGDEQVCRIRVRNTSTEAITGITVDRPTPNTITNRYAYKSTLACDLGGCAPFDLAPGKSLIIFEEATFNATQDGRGLTTATATGDIDGVIVSGSGTEQKSLP